MNSKTKCQTSKENRKGKMSASAHKLFILTDCLRWILLAILYTKYLKRILCINVMISCLKIICIAYKYLDLLLNKFDVSMQLNFNSLFSIFATYFTASFSHNGKYNNEPAHQSIIQTPKNSFQKFAKRENNKDN